MSNKYNEEIEEIKFNSKLEEYKYLILSRDKLRKEEERIWRNYIIEFGELIEENFNLNLKCIRLKKTISFCQSKINNGQEIKGEELDYYLEKVLVDYEEKLTILQEIRKSKSTFISNYNVFNVKKIYKEIAMLIHPDLHPNQELTIELLEFWERTKIAYTNNDLKELIQLKILILDKLNINEIDTYIDETFLINGINEINEEIDNIVLNEPYRFKYLLNDEKAKQEKQESLKIEIQKNKEYLVELEKQVDCYNIKRLVN